MRPLWIAKGRRRKPNLKEWQDSIAEGQDQSALAARIPLHWVAEFAALSSKPPGSQSPSIDGKMTGSFASDFQPDPEAHWLQSSDQPSQKYRYFETLSARR
jgi:hypothetical protein